MKSHFLEKNGYIFWMPIVIVEIFLIFTLASYQFGPWLYSTIGDNRVLWYMSFYQICLFIGFSGGVIVYKKPIILKYDTRKAIFASFIIFIILYLPTTYSRTGSILPNIISGIINPGEAYKASLKFRSNSAGVIIEYIRIVLSYYLYVFFPLGVFFWKDINRLTKILVITGILLTLSLYLSMGTNKAIFDFAVLIPLIYIIGSISAGIKVNLKRFLATLAAIIIFLSAATLYFSTTQSSREGSGNIVGYFPPGRTMIDQNYPLVRESPTPVRVAVLGLSNYLSQGYFAFGLALREQFTSTFGLGSSTFISRQVEELTGSNTISEHTYPAKIEKYGWDRYVYWSSIYLWIASDVGFIGTGLVCIIIGMLFSYTWLDIILFRLPSAVILFTQLVIMLIYFSANNQIGQNGETLVCFIISIFAWLFGRSGIRFVIRGKA